MFVQQAIRKIGYEKATSIFYGEELETYYYKYAIGGHQVVGLATVSPNVKRIEALNSKVSIFKERITQEFLRFPFKIRITSYLILSVNSCQFDDFLGTISKLVDRWGFHWNAIFSILLIDTSSKRYATNHRLFYHKCHKVMEAALLEEGYTKVEH